ncbi:MAG TPA: glucose-6-phosphate dehydrogenase [Acidisoma sp.]|uniref:glucose-6-phosphate dehydrogenase n=1 Tax=Acidisoma sp. TaxID=1872115 RepID=UPI002B5513EA|nr:glucose-6-phosphate dehydrogenase [Acidisoma sp.]HTI00341.1 glucose-6-phosphate dehydrogenase [Acidisoma sp.]
MVARIIAVDPFDFVIFGGSGDLSRRKLLPALYQRDRAGQLPEEARIIGTSRRKVTDEEFQKVAREAIESFVSKSDIDAEVLDRFVARVGYVSMDATGSDGWGDLAKRLNEEPDRIRVFYLSTAPDIFGPISEQINAHGLITEKSRVVIEKPLGKDLESAQALNASVGKIFAESSIYRIDHYLGKETVQNLMALRFANSLFEPVWNARYIDHVQITVAEEVGLESRAGYYDTAGAMRDMIQNHILQLLCLTAMEIPTSLDADRVRDEKLKVLNSLAPMTPAQVAQNSVRGQYTAGASVNGPVRGYLEELGHPESMTETFVAVKAEVGNWRWAGVPFYLRTGKRLPSRVSEIVVQFRPIPHTVFEESAGQLKANRLVIRVQPDEGVKLWLMIKDPGPGGMRLQHVPLDMTFAKAFAVRSPDAYERLIMDVVRGNQTLFMRGDEVEAAWRWVDPIMDAWMSSGEFPKPYRAGTWGPSASVALLERDGRTWHEE